jgi:tight adherence protein C
MQHAMMTVADKFEGSVGIEFARVLAETQLGRTRGEAMADMAVRTGSRDLTLFVRAVNQAANIPVKIIIPTTAFMLPTLFILILTPVILSAVEAFSAK